MSLSWMSRFGMVCGVVLALSVGLPGAVEAFTGETAATSIVLGLGIAFGPPALTAFHLRQSSASGRFGVIAYAVNMIGLSLFAGVVFALNLVVFFLDPAVVKTLLAGPTRIALLGGMALFVVGTALFSVSMLRTGVFPRVPAVGYGVTLVLLALLAPLPDTPLNSVVHVLVAASLIWLSLSLRQGEASPRRAAVPYRTAG
ncbi:hypothetical protein Ppa06_47040 [Planomonospora parontospora subsp. parontospora]|uniref:Uncharacterized protein n=2 Tax=Planomonospora parontospora TaxID=58119 RepID=A0AA37BKM3_9ACTN|nr:hypothetical protein [Planomonospora parontospora]GGK85953.1 hypothetical protein GCM10010126_51480 [Planomonospora parontospora]GII10906.1 hypothetical protein Ppa06_47040 [Planomonospora parontospora subsp. parontospora]